MSPEANGYWKRLANELLEVNADNLPVECGGRSKMRLLLKSVADGTHEPHIQYKVCSLRKLGSVVSGTRFDLIYSHAAIEHIWAIREFWAIVANISKGQAWHSYRIDLADHGRRETNYLEMLEWSTLQWWLTMRFVPGAINRWRADEHVSRLGEVGINVVSDERELREGLPTTRSRLAHQYRHLDDLELRATAIDIVGRSDKEQRSC